MLAIDPIVAEYAQPSIYSRRQPEKTPLFQAVLGNLESWLEERWEDPPAQYVEREFRNYLKCGILAHGFARAHCEQCGHDFLIAFSCKGRGVCSSCCSRRMAEIAAHLVDHVIPYFPVRQWVLSLPKRLRYYIHHNAKLCSKVLRIFMNEINKQLHSCSDSPLDSQFGGVSFLQRFGSRLNVHPHYHSCVIEGLFSVQNEEVRFHEAVITNTDIYAVEKRVRKRVIRLFCRHGLLLKEEADNMLRWDHSGFSLDGSVLIEADDREGLERLIRYCSRPPFSGSRLRTEADGKLLYIPPKPGTRGKCLLSLTPMELIERVAQLIPPPRKHRHHYHGVFAPNSPLRRHVVRLAMS